LEGVKPRPPARRAVRALGAPWHGEAPLAAGSGSPNVGGRVLGQVVEPGRTNRSPVDRPGSRLDGQSGTPSGPLEDLEGTGPSLPWPDRSKPGVPEPQPEIVGTAGESAHHPIDVPSVRLSARLLGAPPLRPRRDLVPNPTMGCPLAFDRSGEARPVDNLVGAAVGHAEELGDPRSPGRFGNWQFSQHPPQTGEVDSTGHHEGRSPPLRHESALDGSRCR
jgi:hypothetical protein